MTDNAAKELSQAQTCPCEPAPIPSMECVDRVMKLPLVEAAWNHSTQLYNNVKGYNAVLTSTLDTAESTVHKAVEQTLPVVSPIVKRLETPIGMVDKTLCKCLDVVENAVPCIKQEPAQIRDATKKQLDSAHQQVKSLQELSLLTANEFLKTPIGNVIVGSVDNLTATADKILDFILPPGEPLGVPRAEKVIQALVTIGGLPTRAARHAYEAINTVLTTAGKQDVRENIRNLLTFFQLQNLVSPACSDDSAEPCSSHTATSNVPVPVPEPVVSKS